MRTSIYVDGCNLYYGSLKRTPYKWLDIVKAFQHILQNHHEITAVHYFTARVKSLPNDLDAPRRQQAYISALKTMYPSIIKVHYGYFSRQEKRLPLVAPPHDKVTVIKLEEKRSDVNLAANLVNDAWLNKYECAVVVSNDSDLATGMQIVYEQHQNKKVGLINPSQNQPTAHLDRLAHFTASIRQSVLKKSQLPDPIPNTKIVKPNSW